MARGSAKGSYWLPKYQRATVEDEVELTLAERYAEVVERRAQAEQDAAHDCYCCCSCHNWQQDDD